MIHEKINQALNDQINLEYASAYVYLAMSAHFLAQNLNGFAHWLRIQAQEELLHGMKIYDFLDSRDGVIRLSEIPAPKQHWDGPLSVFEDALASEKHVSASIYNLVDLTLKEHDHATGNFLQWFVSEQVEEEAAATKILDTLKLVGADGNGLFLIDRDLQQRASALGASTGAPLSE